MFMGSYILPMLEKRATVDATLMEVEGSTAIRLETDTRAEFQCQPLLSWLTSLSFSFLLHIMGMLLVVM